MEVLLPVTPAVPFTTDGPELAMDMREMAAYAGRYENRGSFVLAVEKDSVTLRQNDGPPLRVTKVGPNRYVAAGAHDRPRLRFTLNAGSAGTPSYLHFALWAFARTP